MIKKQLTLLLLSVILNGCAATKQAYTYCAIAHVTEPVWVQQDRANDYLVNKIGLIHDRTSERDINSLVKYALAQNLYSDVHVYAHSTLDNTERLVINYQVSVATNVQMQQVKTDFKQVGNCLVAWATISPENAKIALAQSHPVNEQEQVAWARIKSSQRSQDYQHHLVLYPRGLYSETAKARIEVLKKQYHQQAINRASSEPTVRMLGHLLNRIFN